MKSTVYLASDHGGYSVKERVKELLDKYGVSYKDLGPFKLDTQDDYPKYIFPLAETVAQSNGRGIIACRNGQGAAIAANKVAGVRAAVCWNYQCAISSRMDDDSNILSLPADYLTDLQLEQTVKAWLETSFTSDARHIRRINEIKDYERKEGGR